MIYRKNKKGEPISLLGFGCMRFPKKGNGFDMEEIEREIMHAIDMGINYFDTAFIYGGSEEALGTVIAKNNCREKINIATKLPHYMMKNVDEMEKHFKDQLKRLKTDYVDYYLMHMLPDKTTWNELIERGVLDWIKEKQEKGQIRNLGFSYHGNTPIFLDLLNAYDWDFCQIQYNYMDENSQAGKAGLKAAYEKGIPVIIMEPLRGGRLVNNLPKDATNAIESSDRKWSAAEWSFRWLYNQKEVSVVLSGMNSMEMLNENIRIAAETEIDSLTKSDYKTIEKIKAAINAKVKIPCTGCSYCMPCPFGVDIPGSFRCYNVSYTDGFFRGMMDYVMCTSLKKEKSNASKCKECGKCETHCPQNIQVRSELKNVRKRLENPLYKIATFFTKLMKMSSMFLLPLLITGIMLTGCSDKAAKDAEISLETEETAKNISPEDKKVDLMIDNLLGNDNAGNSSAQDNAEANNEDNGEGLISSASADDPSATVGNNSNVINTYNNVSDLPDNLKPTVIDNNEDYDPFDGKASGEDTTTSNEKETTGSGTPATFGTSGCCVYAEGEYNPEFAEDVVKKINTIRIDAGFEPFEVNKSLERVAEIRAKEITYFLGHMRANGTLWNAVAPEHYKAELIAKTAGDYNRTVYVWFQAPYTQQFLMNPGMNSIGVACFDFYDEHYVIAAVGL